MVHFTCDLCGKDLAADHEERYVVKMGIYAGHDPLEITAEDLDDDHMEAVAEMLQREEGLTEDELQASSYKGFRFDLCPCCHHKFLKDPLGRDMIRSFDFSEN
jgi:hypothetical protein